MLDPGTRQLVQRLHLAWSNGAPSSVYAALRDNVLAEHENFGDQLSIVSAVARIACPTAVKSNGRWKAFFTLAESLDTAVGKRTRAHHNHANKVRNLALIAALWSPELVTYYGWDHVGQTQINLIKACAVRYPNFACDFLPRVNQILLQRHCSAISTGRGKTLCEASLQPQRDFNLDVLRAVHVDEGERLAWINNSDGRLQINARGDLLCDVRPAHYHMHLLQEDRYGILVPRSAPNIVHRTPLSTPVVESPVLGPTDASQSAPTAEERLSSSVKAGTSIQALHLRSSLESNTGRSSAGNCLLNIITMPTKCL
jgi:hypothetical protein